MSDKTQELRPCPFCGSSTLTVKQNFYLGGMTFIICDGCGAVVSFDGCEAKKRTISAWNHRASTH